jgi:hypothetical protein
MADRRSWEYMTFRIAGDLAKLALACTDGWRFKMIVERQSNNVWICLLEREKSSLIT